MYLIKAWNGNDAKSVKNQPLLGGWVTTNEYKLIEITRMNSMNELYQDTYIGVRDKTTTYLSIKTKYWFIVSYCQLFYMLE